MSESELRLPADPAYIVVAKRAAAGFAAVAGLHLEAIDDMVIAVAQTCEHAIARLQATVGPDAGRLKLQFRVSEGELEIQVHSVCSSSELAQARRLELERQRQLQMAQVELDRQRREHALAIQLLGLLVDDMRYLVDDETGGVRVRLTKYRAS